MARGLGHGPFQIDRPDLLAINDEFRQIRDNFDHIAKQNLLRITYLSEGAGVSYAVGSTSYISAGGQYQQIVDFSSQRILQVRLLVVATNTETGQQKGVRVVDVNSRTIAEVTWNGSNPVTPIVTAGSWTDLNLEDDAVTALQIKASSLSESMTLYRVVLECRGQLQRDR